VYKKITTALLLIFLVTQVSYASGFQINECGARAMGMAGAFAGLANDPSALYFNPAGITQLKGTHILAGVAFIAPVVTFSGPSPAITENNMDKQLFTPINFYITHQLSDDLFVGLGVNNQYGLGTKWDPAWVARTVAYDTEIRTFYFTPVVAYKFNDQLSVSAGPVFAWGDVRIVRFASLAPFAGEAKVSLKGDGTAWGFTAGLLYKPSNELQLGLSFRSPTKFKFEGDAVSEGPSAFASRLPSGNITSEVTMPMNLTLGAAYFPMKDLTVTADFQYVGWSSYDKLAVDFENTAITDISTPRDYKNNYIIRLGAEYNVTDDLALRTGIFYDKNPIKDELVDPTLPDADRIGLNIGVGYKLAPNVSIDIAYLFLRFSERTITNSQIYYTSGNAGLNGTYSSYTHLFGINLSYNF
jgi:long-chain fatty acid transport protein